MICQRIEIERSGPIATLWLNRPDVHNAFDEHLIQDITTGLKLLDADNDIRIVVVAGRGKSFCAGGDLSWMRRMAGYSEAENLEDASRLAEMLRVLSLMSKPTIARVHGTAMAGGTGIVAACDIAVANTDASFGTSEVRFGLLPATISPYVIRAIGVRAAQRYFLTGERIDAETARALGLVHILCVNNDLDARIAQIANTLLAGAPGAQKACKELIDEVVDNPLNADLISKTCVRIANARAGAEAREGMRAFFEKRKPLWSV